MTLKTKTFGAGIFFLFFFCIGLYINNFAFYFSFKILTSLSFVITGFLSFYANKDKSEEYTKFAKTILIGLVLSFFADVLLDLFFEIGFGFFFIAEITYFIALLKINKPTKKYWIAITILFFAFFFFEYFNPWTNLGILFWPLMVYLFFLISNTVISAKQFKSESKVTKILHIGMMFFLISDFVLQFKIFTDFSQMAKAWYGILNGIFYFPGQLLIAYSLSKDFTK